MALSKEQYDSIIREYDERRTQNHRELLRRREEIYTRIPEYKELEDEIASASVARVKQLLDEASSDKKEYRSHIAEIVSKKKVLAVNTPGL